MERRLTLVPDASVRTYVGDDGWYWVVVHRGGGPRARLDRPDRILVELADGSRDEEAQRRGAERILGRSMGMREASERLTRLVDEGVLADVGGKARVEEKLWAPNLVTRVLDEKTRAEMTLAIFPGTRSGCDGGGGCCRMNDRIALDADDASALNAAFPDGALTPGGLSVDSALRAERDGSFSLGTRGGICLLLEEDGRCGAHLRGGSEGKPASCRSYPLRGILCGRELAVGVGVECRCAVDFAERGQPIDEAAAGLLARARRANELEEVAPEIAATVEKRMSREDYLGWRAGVLARVGSARDCLDFVLDEAAALVGGAPGRGLGRAYAPIAEALSEQLSTDGGDASRVLSASDPQLLALQWGAAALQALQRAVENSTALAPEPGERLLVTQTLFAHGLLSARALSVGLATLALTIGAARASREPLPIYLLPLTTAAYLFRAHGAAALADRFGVPIDQALRG
jgi:hypothetical protein